MNLNFIKRNKNEIRAIIFVFLSVSIIFLSIVYISIVYAKSSDSWTKTDGLIIQSNVTRSGTVGSYHYEPNITFQYYYHNQSYQSSVIGFKFTYNFSNQIDAINYVNKYPVGLSVPVFVNPSNPQEAVLEPGVDPFVYTIFQVLIVLTIILVLINIFLFIPEIKNTYKMRKITKQYTKTGKIQDIAVFRELHPQSDFSRIHKARVDLRSNIFEKVNLLYTEIATIGNPTLRNFIAILPIISTIFFVAFIYFINKLPYLFQELVWLIILTIFIFLYFIGDKLFFEDMKRKSEKTDSFGNSSEPNIYHIFFPFLIAFSILAYCILLIYVSMLIFIWIMVSLLYFFSFAGLVFLINGQILNGSLVIMAFIISLILSLLTFNFANYYTRKLNRQVFILQNGLTLYNDIYINHSGPVFGLVVSDYFTISSSINNHLVLTDLREHLNKRTLKTAHTGPITSIITKNRTLITSSLDSTIILYPDVDLIVSGSKFKKVHFRKFVGHTSGILSMFVMDKTSELFSGDQEGLICIWSLKTSNLIQKFKAHEKAITAITGIDKYILTGSKDKSIKLWDKSDYSNPLDEIHIHDGIITSFSIQGITVFSTSTDGHFSLLHIMDRKLHLDVLSPDLQSPIQSLLIYENFLFLGQRNGTLVCVDKNKGFQIAKKWIISPLGIENLAIFEDKLLIGSLDGSIKVCNIESNLRLMATGVEEELSGWIEISLMNTNVTCRICWENVSKDQKGTQVLKCQNCGSYFHKKHLMMWYRTKKSCPLCNFKLE